MGRGCDWALCIFCIVVVYNFVFCELCMLRYRMNSAANVPVGRMDKFEVSNPTDRPFH
jgi:hypothetical protein